MTETPAPKDAFFFCRLLPPRPTFAFDMTEEERALMSAHAVYWRARLGAGGAVVLGPVADPAGPWGLAVIRAADTEAARAMLDGDPVIAANRGFTFEMLPMLAAMVME
jgi:uncharacterized protein